MPDTVLSPRLIRIAAVLVAGLLWLTLSGCESNTQPLRMYIPSYQQFDPASMRAIFAEQSRVRIASAPSVPGRSALEALVANDADLGMVDNSAAFVPGIRAVLPVYESVLHILVREDYAPVDPQQPLKDASFFIVDQSAAGNTFIDLITKRQGLVPTDYQKTNKLQPGITDIIVYFGPINANNPVWYYPGYELVSLGKHINPRRDYYIEGIGYTAPNMKPKVIPAFTYDLPGNDEALQTVAVDTLLVTRKDIPETLIYALTRTILEQKPRFTAIAPQLFSSTNESFDPLDLNFPLHSGARRYLERDEPSYLERYAETINMVVYIAFLLMTGLVALARWSAQRKKDRIDVFYVNLMSIRERSHSEKPSALLQELMDLERDAFASLINEKLAANESFRIFTDLLSRVRAELHLESQIEAGKKGN